MKILSLTELSIEVMILVSFIMLVRTLFRKQLNPNIRYLLWLFVGIRILIPFQFEIPVLAPNFMTDVKMLSFMIEEQQEDLSVNHDAGGKDYEDQNSLNDLQNSDVLHSDTNLDAENGLANSGVSNNGLANSEANNGLSNNGLNSDDQLDLSSPTPKEETNEAGFQAGTPTTVLKKIVHVIWLLGMIAVSIYVLINNLRFYWRLKRERQFIRTLPNGVRLYDIQGYNCLFGVIQPAIYVDQKAFENPNVTNHIIFHELQHYKVRDHLWQLFRMICLILQWFNPFVWWAYVMSKRDCELACDYRTIRDMDKEERYAYGQSLLTVVEYNVNRKQLTLATSMGNSKKFMSQRIDTIMKSQYKKHIVLVAGIICVILALCSISITVYAHRDENVDLSNEDLSNQEVPASEEDIKTNEEEPLNIAVDIQDYYITCAGNHLNLYYIDEDHVLWGCGDNRHGQLGQGYIDPETQTELHTELVKIAENVIHVDCSDSGFMIYLTEDHKLYGVGHDRGGALQNLSALDSENASLQVVPTPVLLMEDVKYARCGSRDVACLMNDDSVWIWGAFSMYGEYTWTGDPENMYPEAKPEKVLEDVALITGGYHNHAALLKDGSVWTWGYNYVGNCGVQGMDILNRPTKVAEDVIGVWTGRAEYNVDIQNIPEYVQNISGIPVVSTREYENTVIQKRDGSYWICGENVGTEERIVPAFEFYEVAQVYTWQFTPYEEACELCPELKGFMNLEHD